MCITEGYNIALPSGVLRAAIPLSLHTNPPFRLLYDLRWMELGVAGGVEQANYELIAAISRLDRKNDYRLFAPRPACWEWEFPRGFRVTRHDSSSAIRPAHIGFDLVHSVCSFTQPEVIEGPGVLTVQDLQHLHHPEFFASAEREDRERLYRVSIARAQHVICPSEFTRLDVSARYGVPLDRLTTIWNIPPGAAWEAVTARQRRQLLRAMDLEGPFLFYPAQSWPHKNHARLLEAFRRALGDLPPDMRLVLTGRPPDASHPAQALLQDRRLARRAVHLGYRSPLEMRALLVECTALVFPSLFEGFGMPVAEAIVAGKPVACSNVTSLPEIAGDAAVTFDPWDEDDIAARMVQVATRPPLRASLVEAARRRRALFSARGAAVRTLAVYERVFRDLGKAS